MNSNEAFKAVFHEVQRAQKKFPEWPTDPVHAAAIIAEELGELQKAILEVTYEPHKSNRGDVQEEAIQTAAMAIRFLMSLHAYEYARATQHKQGC